MSICCVPSVMFSAKYTLTSVTSMVPVHSKCILDVKMLILVLRLVQALQASLRQSSEPSSSHTVLIPNSPSSHPGTKWAAASRGFRGQGDKSTETWPLCSSMLLSKILYLPVNLKTKASTAHLTGSVHIAWETACAP